MGDWSLIWEALGNKETGFLSYLGNELLLADNCDEKCCYCFGFLHPIHVAQLVI